MALFLLLTALPLSLAVGITPGQIKSFVTFGDSYTDVVLVPAGTSWPVYAAGYSNTTNYPYAHSGGVCSTAITPSPYQSIFETQLPDYYRDALNLPPAETLYTQWIGTNDVGLDSLLTGMNSASIVDVAECMVNWVRTLYEDGARNFLLQNMIPLDLTPLYSAGSYPNKHFFMERNTTEWNLFMRELVLSGNKLSQLMLHDIVPELPDAHIGIFDSHSLFTDMYYNPTNYLNGTAPMNVTGVVAPCVFEVNNGSSYVCTSAEGSDVDSYLWQDEVHPSEQANRIVAREIAKVLTTGESQWATWLS